MPKFVYPQPVQAFPQSGVVQPMPPDPSFMDRLRGTQNNFNDIINRPNMVDERNAWTPVINEPSEHDRNFAQLGWGFTDPVSGPLEATPEEVAAMNAVADVPPPPPNQGGSMSEMDRLVEELMNLRQQQATNMGPQLDHQRNMAGLVAGQGVGLDISPLTSLVDNWTGSNFSQGYKAPPTAEQKMRQMAGLQGGIDKTQGMINQNEVEALKAAISGQQYEDDKKYKDDMLAIQWANAMKKNQAKAGKILPGTAITAISGGETSLALVDNLSNVLDENTALIGPTEGLNALNPYSIEHKKVQSVIMMAKQIVGKTMEGGVLRKEDESKYQKILPNMQDTPEVARQKIKNLQQAVSGILYRDLENYGKAGYDISGFTDKMEKYKSYSAKASGKKKSEVPPPPTPEIGAVVDGYEYKGGNAGDQSSWEKVQ